MQARRPGGGDQGRQQSRGTHALVVIAHQHHVGALQLASHRGGQLRLQRGGQRTAHLVIDADHLLRMACLRSPDVAFLDRRRPLGIHQHRLGVDAQVEQHLPDADSVGVGADDAGQGDAGSEGPQQGGHAAGAAQALLASFGVQQDDGSLLADALGIAPDIAVQHQVADHEHARLAEARHQIEQVNVGHGGVSSAVLRSAVLRTAARRLSGCSPGGCAFFTPKGLHPLAGGRVAHPRRLHWTRFVQPRARDRG